MRHEDRVVLEQGEARTGAPTASPPGTELVLPPGTLETHKRGVAYHYTDGPRLIGIIENGQLWASSATTLNDYSEIAYGHDVLQSAWRAVRDDVADQQTRTAMEEALDRATDLTVNAKLFILSASRSRNSLSHWQGYAGRQGFSVGLAMSAPTFALVRHQDQPTESFAEHRQALPLGWRSVLYSPKEQAVVSQRLLRQLADVVTEIGAPLAGALIAEVIPLLKDKGFAVEQEVRCVVRVPHAFRSMQRAGPRGITPYVRVTQGHGRQVPLQVVRQDARMRLPLTRVTCGPLHPAERPAAEDSVAELLTSNGYSTGAVRVDSSTIPYRFT